jgi:aryl-alcohol dehydrogenase-like predicted oxidoreductase
MSAPDGSGARDDRFVVSTKGGHPDLKTMHISRLSPEEIRRDLADSLERLQVDVIDLYWLHRDNPAIPVGEILDVLNQEMAAGRIGAIGASNWSPERLAEAAACVAGDAAGCGWKTFCASQIGWSLACVNPGLQGHLGMLYMDESTMAWHRRSGLPVVGYSSQAQGFFSSKYDWPESATASPPAMSTRSPRAEAIARTWLNPASLDRLQRTRRLARELGRTPNEIALAYLFSQTFPGAAIIGSRSLEQLDASLRAADLRLSPAQVDYLETGVL